MAEEHKARDLTPGVSIAVLLLVSYGLHFLGGYVYRITHAVRQHNTALATEALIAVSVLILWIGYFPSKRTWLNVSFHAV